MNHTNQKLMFDFRLKVFYVTAKRLNFTKAAEELFISQPAVSKHIHEIEQYYETKLFDRNGTKIKLTQAGLLLYKHAEKLMDIYRDIDFEIAALSDHSKGEVRIGASTTVAQYFLPKYIASFKEKFPDINVTLISNNTEIIENLLTENKIDLGVVEGQPNHQNLKYTCLVKDEIVLCTRSKNKNSKTSIKIDELKKLSFILREAGSGSLDIIASQLKRNGINLSELKKEIELQSTESIKSYLLNSDTYAFLSIHSIFKELKDSELKIIDIKGLDFERYFYGVINQGDQNKLQELFFNHIASS
ncbi:LysR substrate-binding domain-containing protein [Epilithonimonas sp.]|uniref:LysR substrate-binding domain-containing protein n=1 Tax=Epilithonimonas sp. TaxID=2894511 RepID=UPI0028A20237|nr:LysR substrate-binding domain-containing protein [Epilithonimonas sp.]